MRIMQGIVLIYEILFCWDTHFVCVCVPSSQNCHLWLQCHFQYNFSVKAFFLLSVNFKSVSDLCFVINLFFLPAQVESLKDRLEHTQTELDQVQKDNIDLKSRLHKEATQVCCDPYRFVTHTQILGLFLIVLPGKKIWNFIKEFLSYKSKRVLLLEKCCKLKKKKQKGRLRIFGV